MLVNSNLTIYNASSGVGVSNGMLTIHLPSSIIDPIDSRNNVDTPLRMFDEVQVITSSAIESEQDWQTWSITITIMFDLNGPSRIQVQWTKMVVGVVFFTSSVNLRDKH